MSFANLEELITLARKDQKTIAEVMIETEVKQTGLSKETIFEKMADQFKVMEESVRNGTLQPVQSRTGLTGGDGYKLFQYSEKNHSFIDSATLKTAANALAVSEVNAAMGKIIATPTAGSAGILPAVLVQALDRARFSRDELIKAMFTASALGLVIANKDLMSVAAGVCQDEIVSSTARDAASRFDTSCS